MTWASYNAKGEIVASYIGGEPIPAELEGLPYINSGDNLPDARIEYVLGGSIASRPVFDLQYSALAIDTTETLSITNIPAGTTVTHPDGSVVVNDGFIDWSCVEPGIYEISFENFPYLSEVLNATVISA